MKLRIQDNSLRLRLSQTEVNTLRNNGKVREQINFPSGSVLKYVLVNGDAMKCEFAGNEIAVTLLAEDINNWADTDQVGINQDINLENGEILSILIEKDFKCLTRNPEEERDMYPNPKAAHA